MFANGVVVKPSSMFAYKPTHLMVDGILRLPLPTVYEVDWFLTWATRKVNMKPIAPLFVNETALMISGIQLIADSHISVAISKASAAFFCDVFSCREFSISTILDFILTSFDFKQYRHKVILRMVPPT